MCRAYSDGPNRSAAPGPRIAQVKIDVLLSRVLGVPSLIWWRPELCSVPKLACLGGFANHGGGRFAAAHPINPPRALVTAGKHRLAASWGMACLVKYCQRTAKRTDDRVRLRRVMGG
jgi:hypothetical protein